MEKSPAPRAASESAVRTNAHAADTAAREPVTVSIGVAAFPENAQTDLELINAADRRLYRAKQLGRNRVVSS